MELSDSMERTIISIAALIAGTVLLLAAPGHYDQTLPVVGTMWGGIFGYWFARNANGGEQ